MRLPRVRYDQGYYLRMFRARYNLTQADAARLFEMSPSHWSLLEDGKRTFSPQQAEKMAKVTGADIRLFIGVIPLWRPTA